MAFSRHTRFVTLPIQFDNILVGRFARDMHKGATTAEQSRRVCEHVEPVEVADSELWSWLGMPLSTADESDFEDLAVV